jgi:hypothetical protein
MSHEILRSRKYNREQYRSVLSRASHVSENSDMKKMMEPIYQ